ncbi:MAG TPA: DUF1460 domain-containing protein [Candidatus Egerieousia sp.]|nr:DUF1460 domain-containing protein [Candidatus Egerieousia sp.]HPT05070.1 DUF1460 domain-containing protein [Candidatus Egerieousia sp.]
MKKRALCIISIAFVLTLSIAPINCIRAQFCSVEQRSQLDSITPVLVENSIVTTSLDKYLADKILITLQPYSDRSVPDLMIMAAKMLIGTPYVAGTLDKADSNEQLTINLHQTDCIIFVETCLNLAITAHRSGKKATFQQFAENERVSRYRNGIIGSYSSRLHYTTEWIRQSEKFGNIKDITMSLGGDIYSHPIFFMSRNYQRYKQLTSAEELSHITEIENNLNKTPITYIQKEKIADCEDKICSGDIICYMSATPGLDIAHVAIACVENGRVGFIHASFADMKVELDKMTINEYVNSRKSITGIKVIRPTSDVNVNNYLKNALENK